jgi:hypothetical protein
MRKISLIILLVLALMPLSTAHSQAQDVPHVVATTIPVNVDVRAAVDELLATNAPVNVPDYVITYAKPRGVFNWRVSVAAADPYSPDWHIEDALWWGTMLLSASSNGGFRAEYSASAVRHGSAKLASLSLPNLRLVGGSPHVSFPFTSGRSMMYGTSGIHNGTLGTVGMVAIDFMGGSNLGTNIAGDVIYASDVGVIDTVCQDSATVGIRTYDAVANEYFVYLNLLDNASLEEAHAFVKGDVIGSLKHGSFDDTCGHADQANNHWHLHWGFMPSNGQYIVGKWTFSTTTQRFVEPHGSVSPGQYIQNTDTGNGDDDPLAGTEPGFFDLILEGVTMIVHELFLPLMPEHEDIAFLQTVVNGMIGVMAVAYVMTKGSLTLYPAFIVIGLIFAMEIIRTVIKFIIIIFRLIKLFPFA